MTTPSGSGRFEGDLSALSVAEIVQTLNLSGKTARVQLRSTSATGILWFHDGAITHASAGPLLGDLAVYEMVDWTTGRFVVEYGVTSENRSIAGDTIHLLLEALRRIDERSSSSDAAPERTEVQPALEADVRRARSLGPVLGVTAIAIVAVAIVAAILRDGLSASSTDTVAAVSTPEPVATYATVPRASATKRPAPAARPRPKTEIATQAKPLVAQGPPLAQEPPVAQEPVGTAALAGSEPPPTEPPVEVVAPPVPSRIQISGKSRAGGGTLMILVDGVTVFTRERLDDSEPMEAEITVTPGEHVIVARLEGGRKAGVHEDSAREVFAAGETRLLRVSANRILGSPVKVKLDRQAGAAGATPAITVRGAEI